MNAAGPTPHDRNTRLSRWTPGHGRYGLVAYRWAAQALLAVMAVDASV
jgi:hypothetical protein